MLLPPQASSGSAAAAIRALASALHRALTPSHRKRHRVIAGVVGLARRGGGVSETFTVRKISNGVGVERIFPIHSPMVAEIIVVRRGAVRRAKLYYLRDVTGKAARIKERKVVRAPRGA